ncbi:Tetratricopeptide repeat-containing protein [Flavobacteriaceae bacterium MAR_2010_188]|nr:Tetratricopeptide repeat-containing protein [Flavobacteriaceae bacterium MAR_2010_188]
MKNKKIFSLQIYISCFLLAFCTTAFAQEEEDMLKQQEEIKQKANDLVYGATELLNDNKFISAEKEFRKAISTEEANVAGNYNLANSYYEKGNFDEALFRQTEAAKVATTKSQKHSAYHNIGNILMKKKMCKEAVEAFKNALRNDPTDDESRYNLVVAKECAEQQEDQKNDENDKDKDKDEEKKDDEKKDGDNEEKDDNKDKGDEDKKDGDENKDDKGKPKDDKNDQKDGQDKQEQPQQPKPQPGQLSPQQIKSLLEAMNNQEQKVQEKLNAEKQKGVKVKADKDW